MKKIKSIFSAAVLTFSATVVAEEIDGNAEKEIYQSDASIKEDSSIYGEDYPHEKGFAPGDYYLFVGASGATSTSSALDYNYGGAGCMQTASAGHADGDFDLNLQLPDGHEIIGMRFYYNDTNETSDVSARLAKFDGGGGATSIIYIKPSTSAGYGSTYLGNINHIVTNNDGYYIIRFNLESNDATNEVCGVRLFIDSDPAL